MGDEKPHWGVFSKACEAFQSKMEEPDAAFYFGRFVGQKLKGMTEDRQMCCMMEIMSILSNSASSDAVTANKRCPTAAATSQSAAVMPPTPPVFAPAPTAHQNSSNPQILFQSAFRNHAPALVPTLVKSAPIPKPTQSNFKLSSSRSVTLQQDPSTRGIVLPGSKIQCISIFITSLLRKLF